MPQVAKRTVHRSWCALLGALLGMLVASCGAEEPDDGVKTRGLLTLRIDATKDIDEASRVAGELTVYTWLDTLPSRTSTALAEVRPAVEEVQVLLASGKRIARVEGQRYVERLTLGEETLAGLLTEYQDAQEKYRTHTTLFENFDQKANQLFNILSSVLKSMKEMRASVTRNIQ